MTQYRASNGSFIVEEQSVKDLGVLMSSDGSFKLHVDNFVNECSKKIGWILRTFYSRDALTMKTLFKSLVLSKIDYCSPLFHPTLSAMSTLKIESIQRSFTRRILNLKGLDYWERLKMLQMQSIERRHERFIIIYMFKILNNLVPNPGISFKESKRRGILAVVPVVPAGLPCFIRNFKYKNFNFIGPKLFNILPTELRQHSISENNVVLSFKNKLDIFLSSIPDQPTIYGLQRAAGSNSLIDQLQYRF